MRAGQQDRRELTLPFVAVVLGELAKAVLKNTSYWHGYRKAGSLTNPTTTQAQIQNVELVHPNIYSIFEVLKHVKRLVLQTHNCRIFVIQVGYPSSREIHC